MLKGEEKWNICADGDWQNSNGTITLGETVKVSDPCYGLDTWCSGKLENVLPGEYVCSHALVDEGSWGIRVSGIRAVHKDYFNTLPGIYLSEIDVGVDSGQCGIYDYDYYAQFHTADDVDEKWYDRVCNMTYINKHNPGYVPFEESEYYLPKYKDLEWDKRVNPESQDRESRIWLLVELEKAKVAYGYTIQGSQETWHFSASTVDGKCYVSSSGDGDGSYSCAVAKNKDNKIVAIEIIYLSTGEDD